MRKSLFFLILALAVSVSQAQKNYPTLDRWLEEHVQQMGGHAVLMIYKDGNLIYSHAVNDVNRRQKIATRMVARRQGKNPSELLQDYDENTKQRIASCSKWLTAALVMTFVDEGRLSLTDSIGKYLPVMTAHGKGAITIWQCLSHLTGIKQTGLGEEDPVENEGSDKRGKMKNLKTTNWTSMEDAVNSIASQPMEGEPGKTFHYGNAGLQLAAAVIETISGKSFETLFQERIAKPCGMKQTDFGNKRVPLAAGGAWSTARDYMQFLQMILNKGSYGGKRVLSEKSIEAMQMDYTKNARVVYAPINAGKTGYGFGEWIFKEASSTSKAVVSSPGLFGSFPWVDYNKGYCSLLFTFNLKNKGRDDLYASLRNIVNEVVK